MAFLSAIYLELVDVNDFVVHCIPNYFEALPAGLYSVVYPNDNFTFSQIFEKKNCDFQIFLLTCACTGLFSWSSCESGISLSCVSGITVSSDCVSGMKLLCGCVSGMTTFD